MISSTATQDAAVQQSHRQLRGLVREVGVLCRRPLSDHNFYSAYLKHIATALNAASATIWTTDPQGRIARRWEHTSSATSSPGIADDVRQRLVRRAAKSRRGILYRPTAGARSTPRASAVYVPLRSGAKTLAIIEAIQPAGEEQVGQHWLRFVQHMALLAAERPKVSADRPATSSISVSQLVRFIDTVHESLDLEQAGYNIVNELRRLLECDRVSLIRTNATGGRMLAISGQDTFDRRAVTVQRLTAVAHKDASNTEALWCDRSTPAAEAETIMPAGAAEVSNWKLLGIIPLIPAPNSQPLGSLVIEQITASCTQADLARRTALALPHVRRAFQNACQHSSIPLRRLAQRGRQFTNSSAAVWRRRAAMALGAVAIVAFLAMYPVRFQVHARGALQPSVQRDVFVEVDGVVRTIYVEHGDYVQAGAVLAELHNSDLEVQLAQVVGEHQSARERLAAVQRQRHDPATPRNSHDLLASESLRLQSQLRSLEQQHELLEAQRQRLVIRSPIAGQVVTWNVRKLLDQRPVAVGQVLLTIADPNSPSELEIFLPESDIAHLTQSKADSAKPLAVEYLVATEPTVTRHASLGQIDARAQLHDEHEHSVRLIAHIDGDAPRAPAGTTVTARIACGQRPIGYVWLHRLVGFVYTRILFHVS